MSHAWSVSVVVACAIAVSIASAEAQNKRKKTNRSVQQTIQQPLGSPMPYRGGRYNLPPGGGINFNDGGQGANYYGGG